MRAWTRRMPASWESTTTTDETSAGTEAAVAAPSREDEDDEEEVLIRFRSLDGLTGGPWIGLGSTVVMVEDSAGAITEESNRNRESAAAVAEP
ncbi:putative DELLA protein SLR1 [Iris pallida]|uniref:DELLA protein SLR1 n=1 Tax=Iris pallida TaxID=29817 RepID=A0AAX6F093_IRIPA|nr:putative DELLA protein SLR1 [Iris pallida]